MNPEEIVKSLVGPDTDVPSSAFQGGRFVLVEAEWDGKSSGDYWTCERPVTWPEVLDLLGSKVYDKDPDAAELEEYAEPVLDDIDVVERKALAQVLLGLREDYRPLSDAPPPGNPFLEDAVRASGGTRPVIAIRENQTDEIDFYWVVLEVPPGGEPEPDEVTLIAAAARGDLPAVEAALSAGAQVNVLDAEGMTPLHHAAAHRQLEIVEALLRAGADPCAQAEYGNSVCFAGLDAQGRVRPHAQRFEDNTHGGIVVALVESGADVTARDQFGRTLVDLAIATVPYPDQLAIYLRARGGRHAVFANPPLPDLLHDLVPCDFDRQAIRVNEVQYRLEHEDAGVHTDTLHWLLGPEWTESEVSAETLFELTHLLLNHGAADTQLAGWRPLDRAFDLFANGQRPQYQVVTYRLRKAGFVRSLRGMLKWLPDGDVTIQQAHIAEVRSRLETEGPQTDTLQWLLSPHGWYDHEVDGEALGELVDELLAHGGENTAVQGRTPLGWARFWLDRGDHPQYRVVVDRLLAAGFTYSVRDFLDRIPKGDPEDQREYLVELRERLEVDGPQPDALHWLLSPNSKWTKDEVSGEILEELTQLLLAHGALDEERDEARPLDRAVNRVEHDELKNYQPVVRRLKAAGFKRGRSAGR